MVSRICKYCWVVFEGWPQSKVCRNCLSIQRAKWWAASWSKMSDEDKKKRSKKMSDMLRCLRQNTNEFVEKKRIASRHKRYDWLSDERKKEITKKQIESNKKRYKESWKIKYKANWKWYTKWWEIKIVWLNQYRVNIYNLFKWKICKYCWEWYYGRNMWKDFCSKECYEKYRTEIWWIWIHKCKMCWKEFKPKRQKNSTYCSVQCANRDREVNHKVISDINLSRWKWLEWLWYTPFYEFPLWNLSYDIQIWDNILIEINPTAFHSSTYSPYWGKYIKGKMYHYDKTHYAINNWYKCINIRDWTTKDEVLDMINKDFIYEWEPNLRWCNHKTGELYNDKIKNKYTVWLYDSWNINFI